VKSLFACLLILLSLSAYPCRDVNLYNTPESPLRKIPIYDQDGDGLCYAYTSAQMIDYYNFKKNPDHKLTSAHWLAFAHKYKNHKHMSKFLNRATSPRRVFGIAEPNQLGYSDINLALKDIEDVGICDEEIVKEGIAKFKKTNKLNDDEFLYLFNIFHKNVKEKRKADAHFDDKLITEIFHESLKELIMQRESDLTDPLLGREDSSLTDEELELRYSKDRKIKDLESLYICEANGSPSGEAQELYSSIKSIFNFEKRNKQLELLKENIFADCFKEGAKKAVEVPSFRHVGELWASNKKILRTMDEALDKRQEPAAIGYCAKALNSPDFQPPVDMTVGGLKPRIMRLTSSENVKKCSPHYSMVVGRRQKAGSCQYMIRNTYGSHFWSTTMDCTCENKNKEQFDCTYQSHGDQDVMVLGCWIPGEKLAENTFTVTAFK
jgi:hypothetical protein